MLKKEFSKTKATCRVTFSLPQEAVNGGQIVELIGEWNDWNQKSAVELKLRKGHYEAIVELATGRNYEFRYLIDKVKWENDWSADAYVPNPFGFDNSVVSVVNVPSQKPSTGAQTAKKQDVQDPALVASAIATVVGDDKKATKKSVAKTRTTKKTTAKKKVAVKKTTTKKVRAKKDDLKKIEGIGPKIAGLLNEAGIITFEDLSKATQKTLKQVLADAGPRFKMHSPATWPKQSKLAAQGKWDKLQILQDELKGGRA